MSSGLICFVSFYANAIGVKIGEGIYKGKNA